METSPVTVFWRPGCPSCMRLRARLHRAGINVDEVNIWEDPAGAAFVRSVAGGNETVPTVRIGDHALVNPSPGRLIEEIREFDPLLIGMAEGSTRTAEPLHVAQWVAIGVLIVLSILADVVGHSALSWGIDAIAIAIYFIFRSLRRRAVGRSSVDATTR